MKRKAKTFLTSFMVSFCCLIIFVSGGFFYLKSANKTVENKTEKVPFYQTPESKGIMFEIGNSKILFYMDFEGGVLSVVYADSEEYETELFGYPIDYYIKSNYDVLEEIIDVLGGVDLETEGETFNYTGTQVVDIICRTVDTEPLKRQITETIISKISEIGIGLEEFVYIIENSETELTVPDCYFWPEYISGICKNVRFVN